MSADCRSFRVLLERELERSAEPGAARDERSLAPLAWHEHLLGCERCRDLLAAEEALEELLATLPRPRLPRELAARVLARLRSRAGAAGGVDELLALDRADAPPGLGERVLASVRARREAAAGDALERLLERARTVEVPAGLAARVLAGLAARREPAPLARTSAWRRVAYALAAGLLALLGASAWRLASRGTAEPEPPLVGGPPIGTPLAGGSADGTPLAGGSRGTPPVTGVPPQPVPAAGDAPDAGAPPRLERQLAGGSPATLAARAPEEALLEALPVLEQWDLLMQGEIDALLSTIDPAEQVLLEHGGPAAAVDPVGEKG